METALEIHSGYYQYWMMQEYPKKLLLACLRKLIQKLITYIYILCAVTSSRLMQHNTEDVIACKVSSLRMARMKHCKVFSAEMKASFNPVVLLTLFWGGK